MLSGFIRIVTHPRVFDTPSTWDQAVTFAFEQLGGRANARGNLVPDVYLATLAIESGCEWVTTDRGFGRFSGLRWRHPLGSG